MRFATKAIVVTMLLLSGCSGQSDPFRPLNWFEPSKISGPVSSYLTVPQSRADLGYGPIEGRIRNALDLVDAKRFGEARAVLASLAADVPPGNPLWTAVKCAEMSVAIRGNDLAAVPEVAESVERGLADSLRPPAECTAQLAIARAISGRPLPLGTSDELTTALRVANPSKAEKSEPKADDLPPVLISKGVR